MCNEDLRTSGVFARERHPDRARPVLSKIDLVADLVTRAAVLIAARVSALDNEVGNHSYKSRADRAKQLHAGPGLSCPLRSHIH
jgi:hypothetical protein